MRLLGALLLATLAPAAAYVRVAQAVSGDVVKGAGQLTKGGKVGLYTVLLQVLNPEYGALKQMVQCCGKNVPVASQIANLLNTNAFQGEEKSIEKQVRDMFVGEGKCSDPGISALMQEGDPTCSYVYSFENKDHKDYSYSAMCVPSDVCAVDVAGATKGLKVGYSLVLQILNRNDGDLEYAGEGPIGSCYEGMNMVNEGNVSFKKEEPTFVTLGKGIRIPTGKKQIMSFNSMKQLGMLQMLDKCEQRADTGVLYVFNNEFWSKRQSTLNITNFDWKLAMKKAAEEAEKDKDKHPIIKMGKDEVVEPKASKEETGEETPEEKMAKISQATAVAEVTKEATENIPEDEKMQVAKFAISATRNNIAKEEAPALKLEDEQQSILMKKASEPTALAGVVDKTVKELKEDGIVPDTASSSSLHLEIPNAPPAGAAAAVPKASEVPSGFAAAAAAAAATPPAAPAVPAAPAAPAAPAPKVPKPVVVAKPPAQPAAAAEPAAPQVDPVETTDVAPPPKPAAPTVKELEAPPPQPEAPTPDGAGATLRMADDMAEDFEADALERSAEILAEQRIATRRLETETLMV